MILDPDFVRYEELRGYLEVLFKIIHRSRRLRQITPSKICQILFTIQKPNPIIAKTEVEV